MCNEHDLGLMTGPFNASLFRLDVLSMMEHRKVVAACMHRLGARWHVMTPVDTDGDSWRLTGALMRFCMGVPDCARLGASKPASHHVVGLQALRRCI